MAGNRNLHNLASRFSASNVLNLLLYYTSQSQPCYYIIFNSKIIYFFPFVSGSEWLFIPTQLLAPSFQRLVKFDKVLGEEGSGEIWTSLTAHEQNREEISWCWPSHAGIWETTVPEATCVSTAQSPRKRVLWFRLLIPLTSAGSHAVVRKVFLWLGARAAIPWASSRHFFKYLK